MESAIFAPPIASGLDPMVIAGLSDASLGAELDAAFARRRAEDALIARLAGEVASRSRVELGADGLAQRSGNSSAADLLAWIGGISHAEARRFCRVGMATAQRMTLIGEHLPPDFETLATALDAGDVTIEAASHIITQLTVAKPRADHEDVVAAERALVEFASGVPADDVRKLAIRWKDALDTDGVEPREADLLASRNSKRFMLPNGLKRFQQDLDPLAAGYMDAMIDAEIAAARRKVTFTCEDTPSDASSDTPIDDPRTVGQIGADAVVELAKHALSCDNTDPALTSTTVVVRMPLDSLLTGLGEAEVVGQEHPISAATARRLAADAQIIPAVLGGKSEILDLGRGRRFFSKAQKLAMLERDGGCICGCGRSAVFLHAHHADWWMRDGGLTEVSRGVLLCSRAHNTLIHQQGWTIRFIDELPYLIPPPTVDPNRTPRRRARPPTVDPHRTPRRLARPPSPIRNSTSTSTSSSSSSSSSKLE